MLSCPRSLLVPVSLLTFSLCALSSLSQAQVSRAEQVSVKPPLLRMTDPPSPDATASDLEARADELHAQKLYLDAIDYYRAALKKIPNNAEILNKVCRTQLMMQRWHDAKNSCELAIKADRKFADPYSNLGVALYEAGRYSAAVKQYRKAIAIDDTSASFFNNLGAALFSKREFDPAAQAYQRAIELDPDVFGRSSRAGVQAQLPSPGIAPTTTSPSPDSTPRWATPISQSNICAKQWKKDTKISKTCSRMWNSPNCAKINGLRS